MPLFVSVLTSRQNLCRVLLVSQSARKICRPMFAFGSCKRSMLSTNRSDFVPPADCNSVDEVLNAPS